MDKEVKKIKTRPAPNPRVLKLQPKLTTATRKKLSSTAKNKSKQAKARIATNSNKMCYIKKVHSLYK